MTAAAGEEARGSRAADTALATCMDDCIFTAIGARLSGVPLVQHGRRRAEAHTQHERTD
jgi:hypothetical protein